LPFPSNGTPTLARRALTNIYALSGNAATVVERGDHRGTTEVVCERSAADSIVDLATAYDTCDASARVLDIDGTYCTVLKFLVCDVLPAP
jgi:hypothetical protein